MLSKGKRLNIKKDFDWLRGGKRLENNFLRVFYKFGDNDSPRIGIAVSSKIFKTAVERNRARRVVSYGFEQLYKRLPERINILAMPKKDILRLESDKVTKELEEILFTDNLSDYKP